MALLDVTDLLADPDFQDTLTYVRTTVAIVEGFGVQTPAPPVTLTCPIIPDPAGIIRQADGTRLSASITVYTQTKLTAGYKIDDDNSVLADVITWHGVQYMVKAVQDWSAYGAGFWMAAADLLTVSPAASS